MKRVIGALCLCYIALSVNAQLLWKISGNGLPHPSYIFGTHHLASYDILDEIKGIEAAFESTAQMVGELKMTDMHSDDAMQSMDRHMMMGEGRTIESLFTPDEYRLINAYVKDNMRFDLKDLPHVKPAFITNNIISLLYKEHVPEYDPKEQLDMYFQSKAHRKGRPIIALETMEFQIDMLFNSTSVERQAEVLFCALSDVTTTIADTKQLADAYRAQDLNKLLELAHKKDGTKCDPLPNEIEALTDKRNIAWMKQLPTLMQEQPTFVAVGALHLPGVKGLLNLFNEAGYTVESVD